MIPLSLTVMLFLTLT